jgi:HSP20 family protein
MSLRVDVKDEGESYFVSAMVPGLKVEDLEITVVDDVVTIKGEFKADSEEEAKYLVQERPAGHFARSIRLPNSLASEKAEAHLENGILTLRIPKAEEAKPKKINVIAK